MQTHPDRFRVAVLGGSAGGLEPYMTILGHLARDTGMAFIVIQHRSPHQPHRLPRLLSRMTTMPVVDIEQGMRMEPNHIYIVPPRMQLLIEDDIFILRTEPRLDGWPRTIDTLLRSTAAHLNGRLVAVILSGLDADGAAALHLVKAAGGITFAQAGAQYESMPQSACDTGCVDYVLTAHGIAQALNGLGKDKFSRPHLRARPPS